MVQKRITSLVACTFLLGIFFIVTSCEDDEKTDMVVRSFSVQPSDWHWDNVEKRQEAVFDLPELTEQIYKEGANIGYIFIGEQKFENEVQKLLPYDFTYPIEDDKGEMIGQYTETISYDIKYKADGKSTVAFYIQSTDLEGEGVNLLDYHFRIVLIW
ncbi:MAG TPA: hypothetical protein DDZ96_09710 [Porphyromonadaceae bacterium]|nr:hypothetical protein [Porphyromonadaceae bacterium]HBK30453.1 hypothetical protein [Porphyromonadaceae bacterium]HBL34074.1 hypothetical protein [Porphyromonadaceae bacterium]HBX21458.1 hypothetical protein [Porphyromonadaceae bacterium]HCM19500.1 hypothetical protein [Porphyromonadaceae bacterium]